MLTMSAYIFLRKGLKKAERMVVEGISLYKVSIEEYLNTETPPSLFSAILEDSHAQ